jgi:CubicO group peptidase (beta-lactamase class C family)
VPRGGVQRDDRCSVGTSSCQTASGCPSERAGETGGPVEGSPEWRARDHLSEDAFFASGAFGQRIFVIPSEKLSCTLASRKTGPTSAQSTSAGSLPDVRAALHADVHAAQ